MIPVLRTSHPGNKFSHHHPYSTHTDSQLSKHQQLDSIIHEHLHNTQKAHTRTHTHAHKSRFPQSWTEQRWLPLVACKAGTLNGAVLAVGQNKTDTHKKKKSTLELRRLLER